MSTNTRHARFLYSETRNDGLWIDTSHWSGLGFWVHDVMLIPVLWKGPMELSSGSVWPGLGFVGACHVGKLETEEVGPQLRGVVLGAAKVTH